MLKKDRFTLIFFLVILILGIFVRFQNFGQEGLIMVLSLSPLPGISRTGRTSIGEFLHRIRVYCFWPGFFTGITNKTNVFPRKRSFDRGSPNKRRNILSSSDVYFWIIFLYCSLNFSIFFVK